MKAMNLLAAVFVTLFVGSVCADTGGNARIFSQNQPGPNASRPVVSVLPPAEEPASLSVPKPRAYPTQDSVGPAFVPKMIIRDPNLPERVPVNR